VSGVEPSRLYYTLLLMRSSAPSAMGIPADSNSELSVA
jgi:hypothetical protein